MGSANRRIAGAFLVGFGLIAGAFLMSQKNSTPTTTIDGLVATVEQAPRERIEIIDSDNDGIPDWQAALQKTEPIVLDTVPEKYNPPETLTDQFAIDFFRSFVQAGANPGFGSSADELATEAMNELNTLAQDSLYQPKDIRVTTTADADFKRQYVNTVVQLLAETRVNSNGHDPVETVLIAKQTENPAVLNELDTHIESNTLIRDSLLRINVPIEYAKEHLNLVNALNAVINDLKGFKQTFDDPLYTMIRLKRHQEDQQAVWQTIVNLDKKMFSEPLPFAPGDYVYQFLTAQ